MARNKRERLLSTKPTVAYLLVLIGGVFVLLGGLLTAIFGSFWGFMMFRGPYPGAFSFVWVLGIASGLIMMIASMRINSLKKADVETWSVIALVFALLSIVDMGGFGIGFVLGLIGSILGLAAGA
ncbi:MAG: hypothetical protein M1544_03575 [Candidatus Marsarchaeota archaeon]|nr:hypothetical protein [Candidatus Marsarchaeota archaeon]